MVFLSEEFRCVGILSGAFRWGRLWRQTFCKATNRQNIFQLKRTLNQRQRKWKNRSRFIQFPLAISHSHSSCQPTTSNFICLSTNHFLHSVCYFTAYDSICDLQPDRHKTLLPKSGWGRGDLVGHNLKPPFFHKKPTRERRRNGEKWKPVLGIA